MTFPSIVLRLTYGGIRPLLPLTPCWLADWSFIFFCVCSLSSTVPTEPLLCKLQTEDRRRGRVRASTLKRPTVASGREVSAGDLKDLPNILDTAVQKLWNKFPRQLPPHFPRTFPFPEYPTLKKGMSRKQTLCFKHWIEKRSERKGGGRKHLIDGVIWPCLSSQSFAQVL